MFILFFMLQTSTEKKNPLEMYWLSSAHNNNTVTPLFFYQGAGSGLSSILPKPKNLMVKGTDRPLIPHTLTKRQEAKGPKVPGAPARGLIGSSASPSAIKAAAKSAAMQVARQIATDEQDSEEDISPQNYFSLEESSQPLPAVDPSLDPEPGAPVETRRYSATGDFGQSDAPLEFGGTHGAEGEWGGSSYEQSMAGPQVFLVS